MGLMLYKVIFRDACMYFINKKAKLLFQKKDKQLCESSLLAGLAALLDCTGKKDDAL